MSSEVTLNVLAEGSQRLNKMTSNIDWIVRTIFGLVRKDEAKKFYNAWKGADYVCDFTANGFIWKIKVYKTGTLGCEVYAAASYKPGGYWYENTIVAHPGEFGHYGDPPLQAIKPIYDGIQQFIDKMLEVFPELKDRLAPLIR